MSTGPPGGLYEPKAPTAMYDASAATPSAYSWRPEAAAPMTHRLPHPASARARHAPLVHRGRVVAASPASTASSRCCTSRAGGFTCITRASIRRWSASGSSAYVFGPAPRVRRRPHRGHRRHGPLPLQKGQRPLGVGFFFSLGHSTVVLLLAIAVAIAASAIVDRDPADGARSASLHRRVGVGHVPDLIGVLNLSCCSTSSACGSRRRRGRTATRTWKRSWASADS